MADPVETVEETPWWLEVNDARAAEGTATPELIEALAAGRMIAEGYIAGPADLQSLSLLHDPPGCIGVRARVPAERFAAADALRAHRAARRCGARHFLDCGDLELLRPRRGSLPLPDEFDRLFRELFGRAERQRKTGGMHTAALTDGTRLLYQVEDVGRHNAVDKTIGRAWLEGAEPARFGLLLSARMSAEIVVKAARAGVSWIASRSIPTDLALEIARAAALPLVARAPGKDARVLGVTT